MNNTLSREDIEKAFDIVGRKGAARGLMLEVAVYGGSCLILASNIRLSSGDVDAVFLKHSRDLKEIVGEVAGELGLPANWMNEAVKRMAPPPGDPEPPLRPFGDYPRDTGTGVGLRVFLPVPEYMLAMKLLANRDDGLEKSKIQTDQSDTLKLMRLTRLDTKEQLSDLMQSFYPNLPGMFSPTLNPRIEAKIDDLLDQYQRISAEPPPRWNSRRSGMGGLGE